MKSIRSLFDSDVAKKISAKRHSGQKIGIAILLAIIVSLVLVWKLTPLSEWIEPRRLLVFIRYLAHENPLAPLLISSLIAIGNLLMIPINVLLLAVALAFPGWQGFFYGMGGAVLTALLQAWIGRRLGAERVARVFGERFKTLSEETRHNGVSAVVVMCLVPVAPNIATNIMAGICSVPYWKLALGTVIGFLPGLIILNLLGREMRAWLQDPSLGAAIAGVGLIGLLILANVIAKRYKQRVAARSFQDQTTSSQEVHA